MCCLAQECQIHTTCKGKHQEWVGSVRNRDACSCCTRNLFSFREKEDNCNNKGKNCSFFLEILYKTKRVLIQTKIKRKIHNKFLFTCFFIKLKRLERADLWKKCSNKLEAGLCINLHIFIHRFISVSDE